MRKIYFNGYLITLRENDWFQDRDGKWHHLVIQEQTQESECEHRWCYLDATSDKERCSYCGMEKPAKKECEHEWIQNDKIQLRICKKCSKLEPAKDELAELIWKNIDGFNYADYGDAKTIAYTVRKWAVEVVEKLRKDDVKRMGIHRHELLDELLERLREGK